MNDRELLERAARAAGVSLWQGSGGPFRNGVPLLKDGSRLWNPLMDDGDAFRLMHTLRLDTHHGENEHGEGIITVLTEEGCWADAPKCEEYDIAGFRRAIVRAAAAMEAPCQ